MRHRCVWLAAALLLGCAAVEGQERPLTLHEALALARERGPGTALARGRVEEARARQARAGRRLQEEPVLEVAGGPRRGDEETTLDVEMALSQGLETGGRRAARRAGARAALARADAEAAEAERRLAGEVAAAFVRAVAARERSAALARGRGLTDRLLAATERRAEAGEATALELNRAAIAAASARAGQAAAEAEHRAALARLAALAGLEPGAGIAVAGDLEPGPAPDVSTLLAGLERRPDLAGLAAELEEAEAEAAMGRALARPGLGLRGAVEREEGAEVLLAGVAVSLPVAGRSREALAVAAARSAALRAALDAARRAAEAEVRGAAAALAHRVEAARELERTALPALDDNESLAEKSFEAGELDLGELLLVRREILETRLAYLDRLLEAALARVELEAAAGALP